MIRTLFLFSILVLGQVLVPSSSRAETGRTHLNFSASTGYASFDQAFGFDSGLVLEGRAGIVSRGIGLEVSYGKVLAESRFCPDRDSPADHYGVDLVWTPLPDSKFRPFLTAGWARFDLDQVGNTKTSLDGWEAGGGVRLGLFQTLNHETNLRLGIKDIVVEMEDPFEDAGQSKHTLYFSAEIELRLPPSQADTDADGVPDVRDGCPNTHWGVPVDERGCDLDGDGDGVPDGRDICPGTRPGTRVDERGCPLR